MAKAKGKRKMGRPKTENPRASYTWVRLSDDEKAELQEAAQESGIGDLSTWMRFVCKREARKLRDGK